MGITYEVVQKINPAVIFVSFTGFGLEGDYASRPAFDELIQAFSGAASVTGFPDFPPTVSGVPWVDYGTGTMAALGTLLALYNRQRTGVGQAVGASLLQTAIFFMAHHLIAYAGLGVLSRRVGDSAFWVGPSEAFHAQDGWVYITAVTDDMWKRLSRTIGRQDLVDGPRCRDPYTRFENRNFINSVINEWVGQRKVEEVLIELEKARIPCGPFYSRAEVINDSHVRQQKLITEIEHPGVGVFPVPAYPINFSLTPGQIETDAPQLGEHNRDIYCDLMGMILEEYSRLKEEGIV